MPEYLTWQGLTVQQYFEDMIETWEGGFQAYAEDRGNWVNGRLIGTKYGVTPAALAAYGQISPDQITREDMLNLTLAEAANIGLAHYYAAPRFNRLPWNPVTAAVVDFGWMSGPVQAIKQLQREIGAADDGLIGPITVRCFEEWLIDRSVEQCARLWARRRIGFYERICEIRPSNEKFLKGWKRRANSYLPDTDWWSLWTIEEIEA